MSHRMLVVAVLALTVFSSARSQEPAPQITADETVARQKKAFELLDSVADQVGTLRSPENRARIGSNVADLLWSHDERRARGIFVAVEEDINAGLRDSDTDEQRHRHTMLVFGQLRGNIIERIAKHDPELAMEFLRATRPPEDEQRPYEMEDEKSLELRLAGMIATRNPQLALKLGLQSLAKGFSEDLLPVLAQLQRTDKATSLSFYKAIVDKLKDANLAQDYLAMELVMSLAQNFPPPLADEQVYRDLIGVLWKTAEANDCANANTKTDDAPPICFQIASLLPRIEKYYGARAAPLKRWTPEAQSPEEAASMSRWGEIREVLEKGTVDEIMALAASYPEFQTPIYSRAYDRARESGDLARARKIAGDFPDEAQRPYLIAQLDKAQGLKAAVTPEQMAEIQRRLNSITGDAQRIRFLMYAAGQIGGGDRKAALGLLNQADQLLSSGQPGKAQVEGQITLAVLYCSLRSDRGLALMEALMPRLNELVAAAAALDGFDNNYLREGEWTMTSAGGVGSILTQLAQSAGYFANFDLERSITLAAQFERPELRLMAKSKIAQALLSTPTNQPPVSQAIH
jgi:hypothetical protein